MSAENGRAPWTEAEVANLAAWQALGYVHPYTCGNDACRADLVPTRDGWFCPNCGYTQDWAHAAALDGSTVRVWQHYRTAQP